MHFFKTSIIMKSCIKHFASLCLVIVFSFFLPNVGLCQSDGNSVDSVSNENSTYVKGITPSRARSLAGVALGVISIGIGWVAKRRTATNKKNARPWSITASIFGIAAIVLSIVHLIATSGGFGTGGGKAGAIVALLLGILGAYFGTIGLRTNRKVGVL
jgi:hypothetical protein